MDSTTNVEGRIYYYRETTKISWFYENLYEKIPWDSLNQFVIKHI